MFMTTTQKIGTGVKMPFVKKHKRVLQEGQTKLESNKRKFNITSSTSRYQKETGDVFVFTTYSNGNVKTSVEVFNVLGMGSWNVILIIENGKYVPKVILAQSLHSKEEAVSIAKKEIARIEGE